MRKNGFENDFVGMLSTSYIHTYIHNIRFNQARINQTIPSGKGHEAVHASAGGVEPDHRAVLLLAAGLVVRRDEELRRYCRDRCLHIHTYMHIMTHTLHTMQCNAM